jgi:hypothetical protein
VHERRRRPARDRNAKDPIIGIEGLLCVGEPEHDRVPVRIPDRREDHSALRRGEQRRAIGAVGVNSKHIPVGDEGQRIARRRPCAALRFLEPHHARPVRVHHPEPMRAAEREQASIGRPSRMPSSTQDVGVRSVRRHSGDVVLAADRDRRREPSGDQSGSVPVVRTSWIPPRQVVTMRSTPSGPVLT